MLYNGGSVENQLAIMELCAFYHRSIISCCHGDVRLMNGYTPNEGRVEVCLSNQWKTVCSSSWDSTDAGVVCVQLGFMRESKIQLDDYI